MLTYGLYCCINFVDFIQPKEWMRPINSGGIGWIYSHRCLFPISGTSLPRYFSFTKHFWKWWMVAGNGMTNIHPSSAPVNHKESLFFCGVFGISDTIHPLGTGCCNGGVNPMDLAAWLDICEEGLISLKAESKFIKANNDLREATRWAVGRFGYIVRSGHTSSKQWS